MSGFSNSDLEGTSWDVTAVEFDVYGVDAVLPGDEPDSVLVWRTEQREILVKSDTPLLRTKAGLETKR